MQTGPVIAITKGITKEVIKTSNELMHSAPIASSRFPTHLTNLEFRLLCIPNRGRLCRTHTTGRQQLERAAGHRDGREGAQV